MFKPRIARQDLRRYRRKGLGTVERGILEAASAQGLRGARVLEIGGGIGTIQAELLVAGASRGEIVELVSAYEPYARELVRDKGIDKQSTFRVVDVLEQPETVAPADIVVLNRVVCCSPEGIRLTGVAARLTERILLLSYPRDRTLVRLVVGVINGLLWIMRRSFRVFLHRPSSLHAVAQAEGLLIAKTGRTIAWEFALLRRAQQSSSL